MGALGRFRLREGHPETSSALNNGIASKRFLVAIGQAEDSVLVGVGSPVSSGMETSTAIRLYGSCLQAR